jgi:hypothetical protein
MSTYGTSLAAICCHFNPCHYRSRLANYRAFRSGIEASGLRLLTVELAFGDDPFELEGGEDVLQLRGRDVMWQKERLWQIGTARLFDQGCERLIFLDADVVFEDANWIVTVRAALDDHPVVQCFGAVTVRYSDQETVEDGAIKRYRDGGTLDGHAGFAWAFRRDALETVGLYQHCVAGGGDSALLLGATGLGDQPDAWDGRYRRHDIIRHAGPVMIAHFRDWAHRFATLTRGDVGFADLAITTLPHGARRDRHYSARQKLLEGFDPQRDVTARPGGPFEWTASGAPRAEGIMDYVRARNEDEVKTSGQA